MITLLVNGRKMTFSEEELTSIVEKHFSNQVNIKKNTVQVVDKPTEGKWFKVNPISIDQNLFKEEKSDSRQEKTRQLILEAFEEMKKNPKYVKPFKTMMPKKAWKRKNPGELKELAIKLGHHNADWVEQALEWAQRIANGETWETVCNERDTANWYRLVIWKNGYYRFVGGSSLSGSNVPASHVSFYNYDVNDVISYTVPLVVFYE